MLPGAALSSVRLALEDALEAVVAAARLARTLNVVLVLVDDRPVHPTEVLTELGAAVGVEVAWSAWRTGRVVRVTARVVDVPVAARVRRRRRDRCAEVVVRDMPVEAPGAVP